MEFANKIFQANVLCPWVKRGTFRCYQQIHKFSCYTIEAQCFYSMVGFMVFIYFCTKQSCHLDLKKATEIRKAVQDCINGTLCKLQTIL